MLCVCGWWQVVVFGRSYAVCLYLVVHMLCVCVWLSQCCVFVFGCPYVVCLYLVVPCCVFVLGCPYVVCLYLVVPMFCVCVWLAAGSKN